MPDDFNPFQGDDQTGGTADWSNLFGNDTATKTPTGQTSPTPASAADFKNMFGSPTPPAPVSQPVGDITTPPNATPTEGAGDPTVLHPDNTYVQRMKPYADYDRNRAQTETDLQDRITRNQKLIQSFETPGFDINRPSPEEYHKAQQNNLAYRNQLTEIAKGRISEGAIAQKAEQMGLRHPPGMGDEEFQQAVTEAIRNGDLHTYIVAAQDIDPKVREIAKNNQAYVAQKAADQTASADELINKLTAAANIGPAAYDEVRDELAKDPATKGTMAFFGLHELPKTAAEFGAERNKYTTAVNSVRGMARDFIDTQHKMTHGELVSPTILDGEGKQKDNPAAHGANVGFTFRGPGGVTVLGGDVYRVPSPDGKGTMFSKDTGVKVDDIPKIGKTVALTDKEDDKAVKEALQPHAKDIEAGNMWADLTKIVHDPRFATNPNMLMSYIDASLRAKSGKAAGPGQLQAREELDSHLENLRERVKKELAGAENLLNSGDKAGAARKSALALQMIRDDVTQQKNISDQRIGSEITGAVRQYMQRGGVLSNIGLSEGLQGPVADAAREGNKALMDFINGANKAVNSDNGHVFLLAKGTPGGVGDLKAYTAPAAAPGGATATPSAAGGATAPGPSGPSAPPAGGVGGGTAPPTAPAPTGPFDPKNPTGGRNVNFAMPDKFVDGTPPDDRAKAAQDAIVQGVAKTATGLGMTPTATNHLQALIAAAAEPSGYNTNSDMGMFGKGRGDAATQANQLVQGLAAAAAKNPTLKATLDNPQATPDQMIAALRGAGMVSPEREAVIRPALSRMLGVSAAAPGKPGALAEGPAAPGSAPDVSAAQAAVPLPHTAPAPAGSVKRAYQDLGATPGELEVIHIESGFKNGQKTGSNVGHGQFSPDLMQRYGITNPDDPAQVLRGLRMERAEFEKAAGRPISDGEFYMSHQQGHAGGPALLRAASQAPDTPAWEAIRQFYPSTRVAKLAIWGNIPDNVKAQFGNVDNVTAKAFTDLWTSRFGGVAPGPRTGGGPVVNAPTATPGGYEQPDLPRGPVPRSGGAMAAPPAAAPQPRAPFAQAQQPIVPAAPSGGPAPAPEPVQPAPAAPAAAVATPPAQNAPYTPAQAHTIAGAYIKAGLPVPPEVTAALGGTAPTAGKAGAVDDQKAALDKFNARFVPDTNSGMLIDTETGRLVGQDEMAEMGKQFLLNLHPAIRGAAQGYNDTPEGAGALETASNMAAGAGRESLNAATLGATSDKGFMGNTREGFNSGETAAGKVGKAALGAASDIGDFMSVVPVAGTVEGMVSKGIGAIRGVSKSADGALAAEKASSAILAKGRPPTPTKAELDAVEKGVQVHPDVEAKVKDHVAYETAQQHAKDLGKKPEEMIYAHNTETQNANAAPGTEKSRAQAVTERPQELERKSISQQYEDMHRDVGATDAPLPSSKFKNGPASLVHDAATNPNGVITDAKLAAQAKAADVHISAPAANVRARWASDPELAADAKKLNDVELKSRDLQQIRSRFIDIALDPNVDRDVKAHARLVADNIRDKQKMFYEKVVYPKDPDKAKEAITQLENADQRYAKFMQATNGGKIVEALRSTNKLEREKALDAYIRFARGETKDAKGNITKSPGVTPDVGAIAAARAIAKGDDAFEKWAHTNKAWNSMWMGHFASGAATIPAAVPLDIARQSFRRWSALRDAGSPATFENVFLSDTRSFLTRFAARRAATAAAGTAVGRTAAPAPAAAEETPGSL